MLNLATQAGISVVAVFALPVIVHGLGDERFGLLSFCWLMLGYVGFLDMGLGQATVNHLASAISEGRWRSAERLTRTSLLLGLGLSAGFIALFEALYALGLASFLNLSPELISESKWAMQIFAIGIPPVLLTGILRSVPVSMGRFDLVNLFQAVGALIQWLGSIAVITLGGGLVEVIALFVAPRYLIAAALYLHARRVFSRNDAPVPEPGPSPMRLLLRFGGWMSVMQLIAPMLLLLERVIISRISSPEWITYFVVPQDTLLKLVIIPMSLATTLYPVVSAGWGTREGASTSRRIYQDAVRYTYYVLIPVVFVAIAFSGEILGIWLGDSFAQRSSGVFAVIAVGVLFHGLAQLPNTLIIGSGRPHIPARLLLVEFLPYIALSVWFTSMWGVLGTSLGWLLRVVVETVYLFFRARNLPETDGEEKAYAFFWKGALVLGLCGLPAIGAKIFGMGIVVCAVAAGACLAAYSLVLWFVVFGPEDRGRIRAVFRLAAG